MLIDGIEFDENLPPKYVDKDSDRQCFFVGSVDRRRFILLQDLGIAVWFCWRQSLLHSKEFGFEFTTDSVFLQIKKIAELVLNELQRIFLMVCELKMQIKIQAVD